MFDICSAPGMFIFSAENFFKKHGINLNWKACSLVDISNKKVLSDIYYLYYNNKEKFIPCDLLKEENIIDLIKYEKNKYDLVTGDAGIFFDDYKTLQEYKLSDIQYTQMIIALYLCKDNMYKFRHRI